MGRGRERVGGEQWTVGGEPVMFFPTIATLYDACWFLWVSEIL